MSEEATTTNVQVEEVLEAGDIPTGATIHHMEWFPSHLEITWSVEE